MVKGRREKAALEAKLHAHQLALWGPADAAGCDVESDRLSERLSEKRHRKAARREKDLGRGATDDVDTVYAGLEEDPPGGGQEWGGFLDVVDGRGPDSGAKRTGHVQVIQDPSASLQAGPSRSTSRGSARKYMSSKVSVLESWRSSGDTRQGPGKDVVQGQVDGEEEQDRKDRMNDTELQRLLASSGLLRGSGGNREWSAAVQELAKNSKEGKERHKEEARQIAHLIGREGNALSKQPNTPQGIAVGMARKRLERRRQQLALKRQEESSRAGNQGGQGNKKRGHTETKSTRNLAEFLRREEAERKIELGKVKGNSNIRTRTTGGRRDRGIGNAIGHFKGGTLRLNKDDLARLQS